MFKSNLIAVTLFLGALSVTGTVVANEPTVSKVTDKFAVDFNTSYINLKPTLAKSYTKKNNFYFGLVASNSPTDTATLFVELTNLGSPSDTTDILNVKFTIDGEEFTYRNRSDTGKSKLIDPRMTLATYSKTFRIPKDIIQKISNSNTTLYEITTDTLAKGQYIHKGYIKEGEKKTKAFKSIEKTSKLFSAIGTQIETKSQMEKYEKIKINLEDGESNLTNVDVSITTLDDQSSISESNIKHLVELSKIGLNLKNRYSFKPKSIYITIDKSEGKITLNYTAENSYGANTPGTITKYILKANDKYTLE